MRQVDSSGPDKLLLIHDLQSLPLLGHHYIFSTLPHIHCRTRELKTSSAQNAIFCSLLLTTVPSIALPSLLTCAKGFMQTVKRVDERGHPQQVDLSSSIWSVRRPFILILAVGAEYNVLILIIDFSVNPNCSKTENRYFQLTQSKAFSASKLAKT